MSQSTPAAPPAVPTPTAAAAAPPVPDAPVWTVVDSPIGELRLVAQDGALVAVDFSPFEPTDARVAAGERRDDEPVLVRTREQLSAYFARELTDFDLPLAPRGTDFQRRVWDQLRTVGHGSTASYSEVARALGMTNAASRAVGLANARNPIPVVIPCHRVVGADGSLTGYAGGLARKRLLLDLEQPEDLGQEGLFQPPWTALVGWGHGRAEVEPGRRPGVGPEVRR